MYAVYSKKLESYYNPKSHTHVWCEEDFDANINLGNHYKTEDGAVAVANALYDRFDTEVHVFQIEVIDTIDVTVVVNKKIAEHQERIDAWELLSYDEKEEAPQKMFLAWKRSRAYIRQQSRN